MEKTVKMALALLIIIVLTAVTVYAILPYLNYFFGAFILYVIFRPMYQFFLKKVRIPKKISAVLVIIISIFVLLIPLYYILNIIISELRLLLFGEVSVFEYIQSGVQSFTYYLSNLDIPLANFDIAGGTLQTKIQERVMDISSEIINYTSIFILGSIQNLTHQSISLLIMYFLLYYLLTGEDSDFIRKIHAAIPFNEENTATLISELRRIVRTTIISSGAVVLAQGAILTIAFLIFDVQGAFLWGALATIFAFVPVFGSTLIWVPATIIQLFEGDYIAGIGILAAGLIASIMDSFLRPLIQKRVGEIHPLLSLIGIVVGISLFGLIGIVIGPLLVSYFILTVVMFSREYLS
jgi:predicted PurR-regulated permease PerM